MSASIPSFVPGTLRAGDTWQWTQEVPDYPATEGWTLKYRFKNAAGGFEVTASASGTAYAVTVSAATSAAYAAGAYAYVAWVAKDGVEQTVLSGRSLQVLPNLRSGDAAAGLDLRSNARKRLDALEAALLARDPSIAAHMIQTSAGPRSVTYSSLADVRVEYDRVKAEVLAEQDAARVANGGKSLRNFYVRFGR